MSRDLEAVSAEIRYRIDRMRLFGETDFKDWVEWLADLETDLDTAIEDQHDECFTQDQLDQNTEDRTEFLKERIDELETKVSDLEADVNVYNERLARGVDHAIRCEDFIFTPEDARATFRIVE